MMNTDAANALACSSVWVTPMRLRYLMNFYAHRHSRLHNNLLVAATREWHVEHTFR